MNSIFEERIVFPMQRRRVGRPAFPPGSHHLRDFCRNIIGRHADHTHRPSRKRKAGSANHRRTESRSMGNACRNWFTRVPPSPPASLMQVILAIFGQTSHRLDSDLSPRSVPECYKGSAGFSPPPRWCDSGDTGLCEGLVVIGSHQLTRHPPSVSRPRSVRSMASAVLLELVPAITRH